MSIESVMPSNHLILYHLLLLPSIFLNISIVSNELALRIRWPNFPLGLTGLISSQSKGLFSRVFSKTTVRNHQFFRAQPSLWSNSHIHTWLLEKPQLRLDQLLSAMWCLCFLIQIFSFAIAFLSRSKCLKFMAMVTVCSDFGAQEKNLPLFPFLPHLFAMK